MSFLFSKGDLRATLERHAQKARELVLSRSAQQVVGEAGDAFVVELEKEYRVKPLQLIESGLEIEHEETKVDVRRDPFRTLLDRNRPCYVPGQRVRYIVPFEGDRMILQVTPSTIMTNVPRAKIEGSELVFEFEVTNENVHRTKADFEARC